MAHERDRVPSLRVEHYFGHPNGGKKDFATFALVVARAELMVGMRFPAKELPAYVIAQVLGGWALQQLWLFWIVPILGAAIVGLVYLAISSEPGRHQHCLSEGQKNATAEAWEPCDGICLSGESAGPGRRPRPAIRKFPIL
jgi:hypothetical protein